MKWKDLTKPELRMAREKSNHEARESRIRAEELASKTKKLIDFGIQRTLHDQLKGGAK